MKKILDFQKKEVVSIFDEVNLWTAKFGRLMLENIPMKKGMTIVDVGFGTGFPLIELGQRFGNASKIYGVDIWQGGIERAKEKMRVLEINNIEILEGSATNINLDNNSVDLVTSNLGVNNFEEREKVYVELHRILKPGGKVAITTNTIGTFEELFDIFEEMFVESGATTSHNKLKQYIDNRNTVDKIITEFATANLKVVKQKQDKTNMRFVDAQTLLDHSLIRVGFKEEWDQLVDVADQASFYNNLCTKVDKVIEEQGEFKMSIPLLYLEFEK